MLSRKRKKKLNKKHCYFSFGLTKCMKFSCTEKRPLLHTFFESVITHTECMTYAARTHSRNGSAWIMQHLKYQNMPVPFPTSVCVRARLWVRSFSLSLNSRIAFKNRSNTIDDDKYSKTWPPFVFGVVSVQCIFFYSETAIKTAVSYCRTSHFYIQNTRTKANTFYAFCIFSFLFLFRHFVWNLCRICCANGFEYESLIDELSIVREYLHKNKNIIINGSCNFNQV